MGDTPNSSTLSRGPLAVPSQTYAEEGAANAAPSRQVLEDIPVSLMKDSSRAAYSFEEDVQSTEMSGGSARFPDFLEYSWDDWLDNDFSARYAALCLTYSSYDIITLLAYLANHHSSYPKESTLQTDISHSAHRSGVDNLESRYASH